jgi:hypothetical protein
MAETYFEAVELYQNKSDACPECWVRSFDLSLERKTNLLQDALLGMNAHINYDLTIATYDILQRFQDLQQTEESQGLDRTLNRHLKRRYYDYLMINQIAWESIPLIQDVLTERFNPFLGILNKLSFRISRFFMEKIIMEYRDRSWGHALLMVSTTNQDEMKWLKKFMDLQAVRNIPRVMSGLSRNPLTLTKGVVQGFPLGESDISSRDYSAIGKMLISRLQNDATTSHASRAIIDYGEAAESFLISTLKDSEAHSPASKQIIRILSETASESAQLTLVELLDKSDTRTRDLLYSEFSSMARRGKFTKKAEKKLLPQIRREASECLVIKQQLTDLEKIKELELLKSTLTFRLSRSLLRQKTLLALVSSAQEHLPAQHAFLGNSAPELIEFPEINIRKFPENDQQIISSIKTFFTSESVSQSADWTNDFNLPSKSWQEWIRDFLSGADRWLQLCSMYLVLNQKWLEFSDQVERIFIENPLLVEYFPGLHLPASKIRSDNDIIRQWSERKNKMLSTIEKVLYLKNIELFNEIPAEDLAEIARLTHEMKISNGDYLIREGQKGTRLFIILDGNVEILKEGTKITDVGRGAVVGEMSLLSDLPTSADCRASGRVTALSIGRGDFRKLLYGEHPEIALGLMKVLTERLERTTSELQQVRQQSATYS